MALAQIPIGTNWTRDMRNAIESMFTELYKEYTGAGLDAKEAREKAVQAVADALIAKETAEGIDGKATQALDNSINAVDTADNAKSVADLTREEMLAIIREQTQNGDLAPEIAQARGSEATIGERFNSIESNLEQTNDDIDQRGVDIRKYEHLVVNNDWSDALQAIADDGMIALIPNGDFEFTKTIKFDSNFGVIGINDDLSALRFRSNATAFEPRSKGVSHTEWVSFKHFKLVGFGKTGMGIDLTHCDHSEVFGVNMSQFDYGVRLEADGSKGYSRCHYNTIHYNRISCNNGVHITGDKPNANQVEYNRFSGSDTGIFVEIDRGAGKGPVNTLTFRKNNFLDVTYGIRTQYIISSTITDNRFENVANGLYWDKTSSGALATHRKLTVMDNHYGTNVTAWVNTPELSSCLILEGREDLMGTLQNKFNIPGNTSINGDLDNSGRLFTGEIRSNKLVQKDVLPENTRFGRHQQFTHSTRIPSGQLLRLRMKSGFISMVNLKITVVGNDGMAVDRIIGMDKTFMFGLGETSLTSLQASTGMLETLQNTDVTVVHRGTDYTFDLIIRNNTIRNHSTSIFVDLTNSRFFTDDDGRIEVVQTILEGIV